MHFLAGNLFGILNFKYEAAGYPYFKIFNYYFVKAKVVDVSVSIGLVTPVLKETRPLLLMWIWIAIYQLL